MSATEAVSSSLGGLRWVDQKTKIERKPVIYSDAKKVIQWVKGVNIPQGPFGKIIKDYSAIL